MAENGVATLFLTPQSRTAALVPVLQLSGCWCSNTPSSQESNLLPHGCEAGWLTSVPNATGLDYLRLKYMYCLCTTLTVSLPACCAWNGDQAFQTDQGAVFGIQPMHKPRLRMFFRTSTGCAFQTESIDGGTTWSVSSPINLPNPNTKFHILRLQYSGHLAIAFNGAGFVLPDTMCVVFVMARDSYGNNQQVLLYWGLQF